MTEPRERTLWIEYKIVCEDETCSGCWELLELRSDFTRCLRFPNALPLKKVMVSPGFFSYQRPPECLEAERWANGETEFASCIKTLLYGDRSFDPKEAQALLDEAKARGERTDLEDSLLTELYVRLNQYERNLETAQARQYAQRKKDDEAAE